jgi:hypothetical protein
VDDDPLCIAFPFPVPFSVRVTSAERYWIILAKRRSPTKTEQGPGEHIMVVQMPNSGITRKHRSLCAADRRTQSHLHDIINRQGHEQFVILTLGILVGRAHM